MTTSGSFEIANEKLVHFHIPKAGGTTAFKYLSSFYTPGQICPMRQSSLSLLPMSYPSGYRFVSAHIPYTDEYKSAGFYTSSILRDPLNRLMSALSYFSRDRTSLESVLFDGKLANVIANREGELAGLIGYISNQTTRFLSGGAKFHNPQKVDVDDADIAGALENLQKLDHVGFVEDIDFSLSTLANEMGFDSSSYTVPLENTTFSDEGMEVLNRSAIAAAVEVLRADYEVYLAAIERHNGRYGGWNYLLAPNGRALRKSGDQTFVISEYGDDSGALFGPYVRLPIGTYTATFHVLSASAEENRTDDERKVYFKVTDRTGSIVISESEMMISPEQTYSDIRFEMEFDISHITSGVEFVVSAAAGVSLAISNRLCVKRDTSVVLKSGT